MKKKFKNFEHLVNTLSKETYKNEKGECENFFTSYDDDAEDTASYLVEILEDEEELIQSVS